MIGGGVIGLAIAWRAAQRGMTVVLADPEPGRGASHAAAGMLTPVAEAAYAERELFDLGSLSLSGYPAFVTELTELTGMQVGFRQTGTLLVGYDADDMAMLNEHALLRESFGVPTQRLTSRECRRAEPLLGPAIGGGLLVDDDASVDPRLLTAALLSAVKAAGATH
ncbi:MAG TPA: FAD-dependent oxidoreductase, partial [Streptosporangiaceae bacterium]